MRDMMKIVPQAIAPSKIPEKMLSLPHFFARMNEEINNEKYKVVLPITFVYAVEPSELINIKEKISKREKERAKKIIQYIKQYLSVVIGVISSLI